MSVPPSGEHEALPPPTSAAARLAWSAANLTSAAIERSRFRRLVDRRDPDVARALRLGLGSLVIPLVGPLAWQFASSELAGIDGIDRGELVRCGRFWLVVAKLCAIASTCVLVAACIAFVVGAT